MSIKSIESTMKIQAPQETSTGNLDKIKFSYRIC